MLEEFMSISNEYCSSVFPELYKLIKGSVFIFKFSYFIEKDFFRSKYIILTSYFVGFFNLHKLVQLTVTLIGKRHNSILNFN